MDEDRTGLDPATLGRLVSKLSAAYLESRWIWPRHFAPLTLYSFLLTDPRADLMDPVELSRLSDELQAKLFGDRNAGEISLLLFEGPAEAACAFAALDTETVMRALKDPSLLPPGGRLTRIRGSDWVPIEPDMPRLVHPVDPPTAAPSIVRFQGVYMPAKAAFLGDVISATPSGARIWASLVDGPEHQPTDHETFDAECLAAGLSLLASPGYSGMLYFPISYSSIVRPSARERYERMLAALPADRRARLGAAVYDVPRDPAFGAISQLKLTLAKYFGAAILFVTDPDFEAEKLPQQFVTGVTFVLPQGDARTRLAALRRFVERRPVYNRQRFRASVNNVRSLTELEACVAFGVTLIAGPGVCARQLEPVAGRFHPLEALPLQAGREQPALRVA